MEPLYSRKRSQDDAWLASEKAHPAAEQQARRRGAPGAPGCKDDFSDFMRAHNLADLAAQPSTQLPAPLGPPYW